MGLPDGGKRDVTVRCSVDPDGSRLTRLQFAIRFVGRLAEVSVTDTTGSIHDLQLSGMSRH